ncbi:glycerate kinase [Alicyclobacillus hesperidum subsp. aegles]|uniref:glycerate kinase n=1 Tax=Alicyclobacillus hesperidum TaxID=89784 RepID=UPI00222DBECC|nr:glycerate kinase [Alicyclobacillus hesperidum]GLG01411.1 glycerate kinase [Alicyclobacillus hesperidum subsp. aegles]
MHFLVAPDSFKGSLTSARAAQAFALGVQRACPKANILQLPIADGGEGTVASLLQATGGEMVNVDVHDSLSRPIRAGYVVLPDGTAVLEAASAVGLNLVQPADRNLWQANSRGLGELLLHALERGHRRIIVGLGGSGTNDAGIGLLYALGARFYDAAGRSLAPTPAACQDVARVDLANLHPALQGADIWAACDVANPLCGTRGATFVYGPQKGATAAELPRLDAALSHIASTVEQAFARSCQTLPGAGAAGGIGFALLVLGAQFARGVDLVLDAIDFDLHLQTADLVLTGEGCTDEQTCFGKAVAGVAARAKAAGVPVICISGAVLEGAKGLYDLGVSAMFSIVNGPISAQDAMEQAFSLTANAAEMAVRAFLAGYQRTQGTMRDTMNS